MCSLASGGVPRLSVIVPILNEAEILSHLLEMLALQRGLDFEVILCDGGSDSASGIALQSLAPRLPFDCRICHSSPGRGRQLNAGIACSRAAYFLFLHADSTFDDPRALVKGYDTLINAHRRAGHGRIAGHFALTFKRQTGQRSWAFFHHAWKARLHRPYCVHGDQGFMLSRGFFEQIGPFDQTLPFLEDVRLSAAVADRGSWMLLPAVIGTSARRFEAEGFYRRQALNALLLACEAAGHGDWLADMPGVYRKQACCSRLALAPFFRAIDRRLAALSLRRRTDVWRQVGRFVCQNAWQLALMVDTLRYYRKGKPVGDGPLSALAWFDRNLAPMVDRPAGWWLAAAPAWAWFHLHRIVGRGA